MLERHHIAPLRSALLYPRPAGKNAYQALTRAAAHLSGEGVRVAIPREVADDLADAMAAWCWSRGSSETGWIS